MILSLIRRASFSFLFFLFNRYMFFIKFLLLFVLSIGTNVGKKRDQGKAKGINAGDGEIEVEIYDVK